jgi:DNA-binding transcriptional ArsR family regulator
MMDDDAVWRALADPTRRALLDRLREGPCTTGALAAAFPVTRFAVMKHLDVLVEAGLVFVERRGRERLNYLNAVPLRRTYQHWMAPYAEAGTDTGTSTGPERTGASSTTAAPRTPGATMDIPSVLSGSLDVRTQIRVDAPRPKVFTSLLEIGTWWPHRSRSGSYVVLEPHVGGRFYEDWGTGGLLYGTVTGIAEDVLVSVHGPMGARAALAGRFTVELADLDDGAATVAALTHQAVGQLDDGLTEEYRRRWDAALHALRDHVAGRTTG